MKRRHFSKQIALGTSVLGLAACSGSKFITEQHLIMKKIKPKKLKVGDTIGLIAPASSFDKKGFDSTVTNIESLGFKVKSANNVHKQWGYLAGSDIERVDDIHQMFSDESVDAIWCIRGGYGVTRILHLLDYELIRQNPKAIIGYSDITALLHAIYTRTGLVGFHGPVGKSPHNKYTLHYIRLVRHV